MKRLYTFLFTTIIATVGKSQEVSKTIYPNAPIPVEGMLGNNRYDYQVLITKHFTPTSKFSFLTVTSYAAGYNNDLTQQDFISNTQVAYQFAKGFDITLGGWMNETTGFSPTAGLDYVYASPLFFFVLAPVIHLERTHNLEVLNLIEFKPKLSKSSRLYTRFQVLDNHDLKDNLHKRSYIDLRAGVSINNYSFGIGGNFDYYGPHKIEKDNYGVFFRVNFL